jgi:DNA-binding LacI/PurR family transcriptional regulator
MKPSRSSQQNNPASTEAEPSKPGPATRITVRQIAQQLNVSHTTVSRALKNDPRISEAVRQKIQAAAEALGYRPDPMLSALAAYRRGRTKQSIGAELAWINCWPDPKRLRTFKEFDLYWTGAEEEAARAGYRLEEFCCPAKLSPERLEKILYARNIRGLLLTPAWSSARPDWGTFDWDKFSLVRFGYSLPSPATHLVTSDQLMDGLLAFESMWRRGYRRIGMMMWATQGTRLVRFSAGYLYAQLRVDRKLRLAPLVLNEDSRRNDQDLRAWLTNEKPDAILTDVSDLRPWLDKLNYRVPQDIGLAALSVLDGHADAGIDQNSREIGRAAVQTLISLIHLNERGIPQVPREVLVSGRWVDGGTLPLKSAIGTAG